MDAAAILINISKIGGYTDLRIHNGVVCGVQRQMYTWGLFIDIAFDGCYAYRYCYEHEHQAKTALKEWDTSEHPPGLWIKRKGLYPELLNPEWSKTK